MNNQIFIFIGYFFFFLGATSACQPGADSQEQKVSIDQTDVVKDCNPERPSSECASQSVTGDRSTIDTYTGILSASLPSSAEFNTQAFGLVGSNSTGDQVKSQAEETKIILKDKLATKSAKYRASFFNFNNDLITSARTIVTAFDEGNKKLLCANANAVVSKLKEMDRLFEEYQNDRLAFIYAKIYLSAGRIAESKTCSSI